MRRVLIVFISLSIFLTFSCGANENILRSGKETPAPSNAESEKTTFARELDAMKTADFRFIHVLRRKDGGKIDAEDRSIIKLNTAEANRRIAADDDKAFIIGSNVQISPVKMMTLYERFAIEDYSPSQAAANTNGNVDK